MTPEPGPHPASVVLVGPPGAGKSTIGRKLARELGAELVDTDAVIEAETGRTIPEIFTADGEPEFRRIEEDVVRRAILAERGIVSLGGGAILSAATRELLRDRTVVYLEISVAEGLRRTGATTHRPLLAGADPAVKYRELMRARRPLYREVASVRVRTEGRSPGRVVRNILARLGMEPAEPKPVVTQVRPAESSGAANRRSRRRRRGGRSGANKAAATALPVTRGQDEVTAGNSAGTVIDTSANSVVVQPDSPASESGTPRRSRRSRRGGRRRSKASNATASQQQSSATGPGTEPSTVKSGRRPAQGPNSGAARRESGSQSAPPAGTPAPTTKTGECATGAAQQRSARSRGHRSARRPAGPPAPNSEPAAPVSDPAGRTTTAATAPAQRAAASASEPAPSEANSPAAPQNSGASARSGHSRRARARRARTTRAQRESEQSA
jgi:shikimate kinase / 3-dehydroquinate synthase